MGVQRLGRLLCWRGSAGWRYASRKWRAILLQYCGNKSQPWSNFECKSAWGEVNQMAGYPWHSLSLEGVFQMEFIPPERLPALVRPAFDLVLRRIQILKRCVEVCGCKIETPRYAPQFGSRLHFKRCQALPKETPFPFFSGTPFFGTPCFLFFFCFFLALQRLARLKCNLEPNCGAYLGVSILQPHACTQRLRLRILRRTGSNAGRTSAGSLSGRI